MRQHKAASAADFFLRLRCHWSWAGYTHTHKHTHTHTRGRIGKDTVALSNKSRWATGYNSCTQRLGSSLEECLWQVCAGAGEWGYAFIWHLLSVPNRPEPTPV